MEFFNLSEKNRIKQVALGIHILIMSAIYEGLTDNQNTFILDATLSLGTTLMLKGIFPAKRNNTTETENKYYAICLNLLACAAVSITSEYYFFNLSLQEACYKGITKSTGYTAASAISHFAGW